MLVQGQDILLQVTDGLAALPDDLVHDRVGAVVQQGKHLRSHFHGVVIEAYGRLPQVILPVIAPPQLHLQSSGCDQGNSLSDAPSERAQIPESNRRMVVEPQIGRASQRTLNTFSASMPVLRICTPCSHSWKGVCSWPPRITSMPGTCRASSRSSSIVKCVNATTASTLSTLRVHHCSTRHSLSSRCAPPHIRAATNEDVLAELVHDGMGPRQHRLELEALLMSIRHRVRRAHAKEADSPPPCTSRRTP
eukprot:scaffold3032_cov375-Prasinococcus_capsulatus_cf.AAC.6